MSSAQKKKIHFYIRCAGQDGLTYHSNILPTQIEWIPLEFQAVSVLHHSVAVCHWNSSGPVNEPQWSRNVCPARHCKVINQTDSSCRKIWIRIGSLWDSQKIMTEVNGNNTLQWCCSTFLYHNVLYIIHQFQLKKKACDAWAKVLQSLCNK
jgi:hypothetical protein